MKLLHYQMFQKVKYIGLFLGSLLVGIGSASAQITTQSPYSKFGVGNLRGSLLPQMRAMGGIATGVSKGTYFNNINMQNPASYATINTTTLDMGMSGGFTTLKNNASTDRSFNATLSHVALAFPILSTKSALSFGILPYSELGYNFKTTVSLGNSDENRKDVDYLYTGEGGLTKAYMGYGIQLGDHVRLGANAEYLFGNLIESRSAQLSNDANAINSRVQHKNNIGGLSFGYGAQVEIPLNNKTSLVLGYAGNSNSKINSTISDVTTLYKLDLSGNENVALDTVSNLENKSTKMQLPLIHQFGFSIHKNDKWVFGADYRMGNWSKLVINQSNQQLQDTYGVSVGGQFTPDAGAISGYFNRVDYRFGFNYDKTYIRLNNQDIKEMGISVGMGLPFTSFSLMRGSFQKMNITAEVGKRGTVGNGLLQENYFKIHLGFTINDNSWFRRFKFD